MIISKFLVAIKRSLYAPVAKDLPYVTNQYQCKITTQSVGSKVDAKVLFS
jgi:phosphotransferase system HPr-like phosphotransfer protein